MLISRKALNSLMTNYTFLISRLLWLCTEHVRPSRRSTFSGPLVACVAGVWKGTGRGFRARGLARNFPSHSLSSACAGYAMANLPRRRSFGSSRNPPQRRERGAWRSPNKWPTILRIRRILFAAKHSWTTLHISRHIICVVSYLQVTWWALGQWKGRYICIE